MSIERTVAELRAAFGRTGYVSASDMARYENAAIDALNAHRPDLIRALLEPLVGAAGGATAKVWQLLGLAARAEQRSSDALSAFRAAARLAPGDPRISAGLATATGEAGLPCARLWAQAVAQTGGRDPEMIRSAAAALVAEGEVAVAETFLERALSANPAWIAGHESLAAIRWSHGDSTDFARNFVAAMQLLPDDLALCLACYRTLTTVGRCSDAAAIISAARQRFGDRAELDAAQAHIATETGDDDTAERLFSRLSAIGDAGTRISHVRHCLRTGRLDRAETIALAIVATPAAMAAWPYLSTIWRLRGDSRAAWLDGDPPYIRCYDLPFGVGELENLADRLRSLHLAKRQPAEQSLRGGTQTEGSLFGLIDPVIQAVRAKVLDAVRDYVDSLPPNDATHPLLAPPRGELLFSGSWSVRLGRSGFHVHHTHPMGWISSAMYVALPSPDALGPPPSGWLELGAPPTDLRVILPPYAQIEPIPGRLVLFPSTMWHGTVPFADGERLTIACDVAAPQR